MIQNSTFNNYGGESQFDLPPNLTATAVVAGPNSFINQSQFLNNRCGGGSQSNHLSVNNNSVITNNRFVTAPGYDHNSFTVDAQGQCESDTCQSDSTVMFLLGNSIDPAISSNFPQLRPVPTLVTDASVYCALLTTWNYGSTQYHIYNQSKWYLQSGYNCSTFSGTKDTSPITLPQYSPEPTWIDESFLDWFSEQINQDTSSGNHRGNGKEDAIDRLDEVKGGPGLSSRLNQIITTFFLNETAENPVSLNSTNISISAFHLRDGE